MSTTMDEMPKSSLKVERSTWEIERDRGRPVENVFERLANSSEATNDPEEAARRQKAIHAICKSSTNILVTIADLIEAAQVVNLIMYRLKMQKSQVDDTRKELSSINGKLDQLSSKLARALGIGPGVETP